VSVTTGARPDPALDRHLAVDSAAGPVTRPSRRLLGWSATSLPVAPLLLAGVFLGPHGAAVLSPGALAAVDPAMPVALAVLGILIGLEFGQRRAGAPPGVAAGAAHALFTVAVVAAGIVGAMNSAPTLPVAPWAFAVLCGVCAASSLTLPGRSLPEPRRQTDALVEAEVAAAIVVGAAVLAYLRRDAVLPAALLLAQNVGVVGILGLAGWLLVRKTSSSTERRVFVMATLLLVGGAADLLGSSPLFGGLCAGLLWQRLGDPSREVLHRETLYVQHPFVVLVLIVAGARADLSPLTLTLAAAYVGLRTLARFAGGSVIHRLVPATSRDLRLELVAPGVFGVAFALNASRAAATLAADAPSVLSVVVVGTVLSDVLARVVAAREVTA
jgi:hypothetical protein